jgi:hypothetical protein
MVERSRLLSARGARQSNQRAPFIIAAADKQSLIVVRKIQAVNNGA